MSSEPFISFGTNEYDLNEKYLNSLNINAYNSSSNINSEANPLDGD